MRSNRRRGWLVLLAPLVVLLTMELLLQLGSVVLRAGTRDMPRNWLTDHTRVLAVGDSNTFGLYLEPEWSYPAQLEARWNARFPDHAIEVLNLGYPGMNSFRVLDNMDAMLRKFRPDVVLLTVGVNDILTPAEEVDAAERSLGARLVGALRRHSRLYHLVHMVRQSRSEPPEVEIRRRNVEWDDDATRRLAEMMEFKDANRGGEGDEVMSADGETFVVIKPGAPANDVASLYDNLEKIHAIVDGHGADLYLLTYAASQSYYARSNRETRRYAADHPVKLVDVARAFEPHCPRHGPCPALFFGDLHPNMAGYGVVAEAVLERLARDWSLAD